MNLFWLIFFISVPVFYFWGLISFIRLITGKRNPGTIESPQSITSPSLETLPEYKADILKSPIPESNEIPDTRATISNWYSTNSINLMLYLGAFLIVAAASIFIGFSWSVYSGITKAVFLTLTSLAFLGSGLFISTKEQIAQAGKVFTAIGALLIPFCTVGWYTFVLRDLGFTSGGVWAAGSILTMFIYYLLATKTKLEIYEYSASLSIVSLFMSSTKVLGLDTDFYLLFAMVSSFILLLMGHKSSKPAGQTSSVITPVVLFLTIMNLSASRFDISENMVLALYLGALYYLVQYLLTKNNIYYVITQTLVPWATLWLFNALNLPGSSLLYTLDAIAIGYFAVGIISKQPSPSFYTSLSLALVVFIQGWAMGIRPEQMLVLNIALSILVASVSLKLRQKSLLYLPAILIIHFLYLLYRDILEIKDLMLFMSLSVLFLGVLAYAVSQLKNFSHTYRDILLHIAVAFNLLPLVWAISRSGIATYICLTSATLLLHYVNTHKNRQLLYISNVYIYIAGFLLFDYLGFSSMYLTQYIASISVFMYMVGLYVPIYSDIYRNTGMIGAVMASYIPGLPGIAAQYKLMTAYASTLLIALDSSLNKNERNGYIASAVGVLTLLRQYDYLDINTTQLYTATVGVYLLILSYLRRRKGDLDQSHLLDLLGLVVLLFPTTAQAFEPTNWGYSLLLGGYGIVLFFWGGALGYLVYSYTGMGAIALAVLSQTYEYIYRLPWWVIVALFGMAFLGIATYLLSRKNNRSDLSRKGSDPLP